MVVSKLILLTLVSNGYLIERYGHFNNCVLGLQLLILQPEVTAPTEEPTSLKKLIKDPYILIASGKFGAAFTVLVRCVV